MAGQRGVKSRSQTHEETMRRGEEVGGAGGGVGGGATHLSR